MIDQWRLPCSYSVNPIHAKNIIFPGQRISKNEVVFVFRIDSGKRVRHRDNQNQRLFCSNLFGDGIILNFHTKILSHGHARRNRRGAEAFLLASPIGMNHAQNRMKNHALNPKPKKVVIFSYLI
jgi:hypothetical protein